jgi:hypothetical protein
MFRAVFATIEMMTSLIRSAKSPLRLLLLAALATLLFACNQAPGFRVVVPGLQSLGQPQTQSTNLVLPLSVAKQGNFDQPVSLSLENASDLPPGLTVAFDPAITDSSSRIRITVDTNVPPNTYTLKIKGIAGSFSSTAELPLRIAAPLYSASLSEDNLTIRKAAFDEVSVNVQRRQGFSGPLNLSLEREDGSAIPKGLNVSFEPQSLIGTATESRLRIEIQDVSIGDYALRVKVNSTQDSSAQYVPLKVKIIQAENPNFDIKAPTPTLTFTDLKPQTVNVVVERTGGYSENIQLRVLSRDGTALPAGLLATFEPTGVSGNTQNSTLKITPTAGIRQQIYNLKIVGTAIDRQDEVDFTINAQGIPPQYVVRVAGAESTPELTVRQGGSNAGSPLPLAISSIGGLSGPVDVRLASADGTDLPIGISAVVAPPPPVNVTASGTPASASLIIQASIAAQVTLEGSLLRVEVRPAGSPLTTTPFTTDLRLRVRTDRDPDFDLRADIQDSPIFTDILENEFSFPVYVVRYGGLFDPLAVTLDGISGALQSPRLSVNPALASDDQVIVTFTPRRTKADFVGSTTYPITVVMKAGTGSNAITKSISRTVTVVDFNIGLISASEINLQPGSSVTSLVTRTAGFKYPITLTLEGRRAANQPYEPIALPDARFPEITNYFFGAANTTADDVLPGEIDPPPVRSLTIQTAASASPVELDLRVVGTSFRPAVGTFPPGRPQSRPHNFLLRIRP